MTRDFADFLDALNKEGVAYVVIGGIAVLSYLPYRTTRDIDVLIEPTLENALRAWRAQLTTPRRRVPTSPRPPLAPSPRRPVALQ